jgi:hypothetical protein
VSGNVGFIPFISRAARNAAMVSAYLDEGLSLSQVGARFGVGKHTVHGILRSMPDVAMRSAGFGWKPPVVAKRAIEARRVADARALRRPVELPCGCFSIRLTRGLVAIFDACDLSLVAPFAWSAAQGAGGDGFYAARTSHAGGQTRRLFLHRLILRAGPNEFVDHRDGDKLNNRRSNLRICDAAGNARNRGMARNNRSGFKGVHASADKFVAQISLNGRRIYIGSFDTAVEAARAYNSRATSLHGEFARLNDLGALA